MARAKNIEKVGMKKNRPRSKKEKWDKPKLIVLVKRSLNEAALSACKWWAIGGCGGPGVADYCLSVTHGGGVDCQVFYST